MIIPEHREAIQKHGKEIIKRKRIEHDDQQKEQIARFITYAHVNRQLVNLQMYDPYEDVHVIGLIEHLDSRSARFKVNGDWYVLSSNVSKMISTPGYLENSVL
ncbi:YolD-like family protein [Paenibacillus bouchesdurhonensis]|uniref:YolD-like family protein n=1 Tax=Paenibacillus bouchesdurhonensis TaxID=1870990 RepID=UPI000DA603CC|nr:YolD-like family protein [Paenibacillus bouchesdurhonensis]